MVAPPRAGCARVDSHLMRVTQVNCAQAPGLASAADLVEAHETLRDWSEALLAAGAGGSTVVQRFERDERLARGGVEFVLRRDGTGSRARPWAQLRRLARAALATRPDVVHLNGLVFPAAAWRLRRVLPPGSALVAQDHAASGPPRGWARRWLWRLGLQACDGFLFTAAEQAEPWLRAGLISARQPVCLVPEASRAVAPLERQRARELSGLSGEPGLLWVGHLDENKDPLTVLEGFARAAQRLPDARLTMVFRGEQLRPRVEACLAREPALAGRVELRGAVPGERMAELHSAADLFVLGSRREGSGYALLEALACGAVPVVSDIPSFRALAGGVAWLWPPGDSEACAQALLKAAESLGPGRREAVRARFERELSWPAVARRALDGYARVLRQRRQSSSR